jgi:fluoride exporter
VVILVVFLGGGIGSICRHLLGELVHSRARMEFPLGTLIVNVIGCLAIGFLAKYFLHEHTASLARTALIVGFCGGFTTFSAFSLETLALLSGSAFSLETLALLTGGKPGTALTYVAASMVLCLIGTTAGYALGPSLNR